MILKIARDLNDSTLERICLQIRDLGLTANHVVTQSAAYLVATGNLTKDLRHFGFLDGVEDVFVVPEPYQLASRSWRVSPTIIDLGDNVRIAEGELAIMMGPCSIESEEQIETILGFLKEQGVRVIRGGAFKPRSSPYSFRGLGVTGLKMLYERATIAGIRIISEVLEPSQIEEMLPFVDIFQVGTRNAQNFSLLGELGKVDRPVLIKRGMSGTLEELLYAAEYVFAAGNEKIMLCERGIRTYEKAYRNTLDINAIPYLKEKTHLPVIVDPSHGVGIRRFVEAVALAGIVAGADGIIVEIHPEPDLAKSDGDQTLTLPQAANLIRKARGCLALRQ